MELVRLDNDVRNFSWGTFQGLSEMKKGAQMFSIGQIQIRKYFASADGLAAKIV